MNYYYPSPWLRAYGISSYNIDSADLTDKPRLIYEAFCTSHFCAGTHPRIIKQVDSGTEICPDCHSYLLWKAKRSAPVRVFPKRKRRSKRAVIKINKTYKGVQCARRKAS